MGDSCFCVMLGDILGHQQASAQAIQSGILRRAAGTSWASVVSAPLISPAFPSH